MKKRKLYKLEFVENTNKQCIAVIRTDNNYGLQGYVYYNGNINYRHYPYTIPSYIVEECMDMFKEIKI